MPAAASDLFGRRRVLVVGTSLFALSSLTAGLAGSEGMLVAARLAQGLGAAMTIGELVGAGVLLAAFAVNESRHASPLFPFSLLRINGLAAADVTQVIAMAGFFSMFFFISLYMQNVLGYSPIQSGSAFVPTAFGVAIAAGVSSQLVPRTGTRPLIVLGALAGAAGVYWLSRIPVHGTFLSDLLPPLVIMSFGLGALFVGVQTAANAGVPSDKAGLAASLITASQTIGGALGIAIFSAIATSRTSHLLAAHASAPEALTSGFHRALLAASMFLVAAAVIALGATNTRGEPIPASHADPVTAGAEPRTLPVSEAA
jgi:MFS family permease